MKVVSEIVVSVPRDVTVQVSYKGFKIGEIGEIPETVEGTQRRMFR